MKNKDFSWITAIGIGILVSILTFGCFGGFLKFILEKGPGWIITILFELGITSLVLSFCAVWCYTKWYYTKKDKK